jgi:hypothetical protein
MPIKFQSFKVENWPQPLLVVVVIKSMAAADIRDLTSVSLSEESEDPLFKLSQSSFVC